MRRPVADRAEVVRRANQTFAEVPLPNAIHHHARREWIVAVGKPLGELEPAAAFDRRRLIRPRDRAREASRRGITEGVVVAAHENFLGEESCS